MEILSILVLQHAGKKHFFASYRANALSFCVILLYIAVVYTSETTDMADSPEKLPLSLLAKFFQPRMLLFVWGGLGTLGLLWISFSAMIPQGKPGVSQEVVQNLLVGEMREFELAFPPRGTPLNDFDGPEGRTNLKDFRGKVILVNFWATWCAPCVEELPSLDRLQAELGGDDFSVVAIAAEGRMQERGPAFFDKLGIAELALYADPRLGLARDMGATTALPLSILYDAKGNEIGRFLGGADWSSPEAIALVKAVIENKQIS